MFGMFFRGMLGVMLLCPEPGDGAGGGSGNGDGKGGQGGGPGAAGKPDPSVADLAARLEKLEKENAELRAGKGNKDLNEPDDLAEKARKEREANEAKRHDSKKLETAVKFNMGSADWLKTNAALLPKTVEGIFQAAAKESYDSEIEKSDAIKVGLVQEFFAQQSNLDMLTESQKNQLAEFQKLTKNAKQERVQDVFDSIFEPTFESLKRIRKAEQLSKGHGDPSDVDQAYQNKMREHSKKHYLRKENR